MAADLASLLDECVAVAPCNVRLSRELALFRNEDGTWDALQGGHPAVRLGEYDGVWQTNGHHNTPEGAVLELLALVKADA